MKQLTTVYVNGHFLTMDRSVPVVEALLVQDGRIAALGPREPVESQAPSNVRQVDLGGRTVVPGLNDCHCHILGFGLTLEQIDVSADSVSSIEDIKQLVAQQAARTKDDQWVVGRGYDQNTLAERRHPTRADLDAVGGGQPVVLRHTSGHALTCNSRALELAGITRDTATPDGGDIERDEHGEPTGVLKESAMDLLAAAVPAPTTQEGAEAILRAMDVMASQGITSASDAATGSGESIHAELAMYRAAMESGRMAGRITLMPQVPYVAPPNSNEIRGPGDFDVGGQPDWLHIGPVKIFSDGAITTRTAALCEPFADSADNRGILIWEPDALENMIRRAHGAGWQIATHAIGDRAIEIVLDCYEKALQEAPRDDHRHRIEHCMLLPPPLAARMQQLGVVPVVQPGFIGRLGDAYISALGMERASQLMPMERFDWLGMTSAFSSDRPVIPGAPLKGIRSAMQRITPSGVTLGREHTISALEGIRHYTTGSAYATRTDDRKGRLARGMLADFTVLSHDPANTSPEEFGHIRVDMTVVGGVETFGE